MTSDPSSGRLLNVNVGVLGHVDCGKTSLVAALSTTLSTAALDKHPQSKERGITLDLGFSSFTVPKPDHLSHLPYDAVQFTLVDCPGHASLIRTIIGGAQIIDVMLLVVDVTKGIQTQTAECLVIGELSADAMIVVLNKIDLLPEEQRSKMVSKAKKRIRGTLEYTKFAGCPIVALTAAPGANAAAPSDADPQANSQAAQANGVFRDWQKEGLQQLVQQLLEVAPLGARDPQAPFLFAVDHCFAIKGQGTVMTGTVLQGSVKVGDTVQIPSALLERKVKSMQMFRKPVLQLVQGDRAGVCLTQVDPSNLERCLLCTPGSVPTFHAAILAVEKVRFYAGKVLSGTKIHVTVGHAAALATVTFFGLPDGEIAQQESSFDNSRQYLYQNELYSMQGRPWGSTGNHSSDAQQEAAAMAADEQRWHVGPQWAYAVFAAPMTAPLGSLCIGARLDDQGTGSTCRIAFSGRVLSVLDPSDAVEVQTGLRVFKWKHKEGTVERVMPDGRTAICKDLLKKESDISLFIGLKVTCCGTNGVVQGTFGKSGKVKVVFDSSAGLAANQPVRLTWKKFIYDKGKRQVAQ